MLKPPQPDSKNPALEVLENYQPPVFSIRKPEKKEPSERCYVEARYNPDFLATKEDIDALLPKVELLWDITKRIWEGKIREYGKME